MLTGEDLDIQPSIAEQAKFEYSPLGKIFNKRLSKDDKKQRLLKRLVNIKDKNDELLNTFNATNKTLKNKTNIQSKNLIMIISIVLLSKKTLMTLRNCHLILCTKN